MSTPARHAFRILLVACAVALASGPHTPTGPAPAPAAEGLLGAFALRTHPRRTLLPRLSFPTRYRRCSEEPPPVGTVPVTSCEAGEEPAPPAAAALAFAARVSRAARDSLSADALHAAAVLDLLWSADRGKTPSATIQRLEIASRLEPSSASVLIDLSAAYLVDAEREQSPADLLFALDAAERALTIEPASAPARFDAALAMDRMGLLGEARAAWSAALDADSSSGWAGEARERLRALSPASTPRPPDAGADSARLASYARRDPQGARVLGWEQVLAAWADATLDGRPTVAERALTSAAALGRALEARGGDHSLAGAVAAIRGHRQPAETRALALAHRDYARGRRAYRRANYGVADSAFARALASGAPSPALRHWAALGRAATLFYFGRTARAERMIRAELARSDPADPALLGRTRWELGTVLLRTGRLEEAGAEFDAAEAAFIRAGEQENLGAVRYLKADALQSMGVGSASYAALHQALLTLRPYRASVWRHNLLYVLADDARRSGLRRAALRIEDEDVRSMRGAAAPAYVVEARLARAHLRLAVGRTEDAAADVRAATPLLDSLPAGPSRTWLESDLRVVEATAARARDPAGAAAMLGPVVQLFTRLNNPLRLLPALATRADLLLAAGDTARAAADLDRAMRLVDVERRAIRRPPLRADLLERARHVFEEAVMLHVGAGRHRAALEALERGRSSVSGAARTAAATPAARPDRLVLDYALIGDTLLTWAVEPDSIRLARQTVTRDEIVGEVSRARAALELGSDRDVADQALEALYDRLLRPILTPGDTGKALSIVADGEVAAAPFAALRNAVDDRYVVEDHEVAFAASLADALRATPASPPDGRVVIVADPSFDARAHPELSRLPGAAAESGDVAALYARSLVLADTAATPTRFERALHGATLLHYAGHALLDEQRPERSRLLLAATDHGSDVLPADSIRRLRLDSMRLVILSACDTDARRPGRAAGFTGLAAAFLEAGARGVVGSLWRVEDRRTRTLMATFHHVYREDGDAAAALRAAQLRLLRTPDPSLSTPAAWAGFRYIGSTSTGHRETP